MAAHPVYGLALCSGVGGLELGLSLALGHAYRTVCYVEREAFAAAILAARMRDGTLDAAPIWDDLRTFDGRPWRGAVDLVSAGYPCQPFSVAGKRRGTGDHRHLWPDVARVVAEVQPALVFLENVAGHLHVGFESVVADLHRLGYEVAAGLFTAAECGAPHRRERLFILAHRTGYDGRVLLRQRESREADPDPGGSCGAMADPGNRLLPDQGGRQEGRSGAGHAEPDMGDPASQRLEERDSRLSPGDFPYPWPPGPADDWTGIDELFWPALTREQEDRAGIAYPLASRTAQPPVRRVAHGSTARAHDMLGSSHVQVVSSQGSATSHPGRQVPGVRDNEPSIGAPSLGLQSPSGRDGSLLSLPSPPGPEGRQGEECGSAQVRQLWPGVPARTQYARHSLWFVQMQGELRKVMGEPPMGRAETLEAMRLLWGRISPEEAARDDVLQIVRQYASLAIPPSASRLDRLRALGNSVVPACAALAFRTLAEALT